MDCLSPEEAQDILRNRSGRPVIPSPNVCLDVSATEDQIGLDGSGRLQIRKQPESQEISQSGSMRQRDCHRNCQMRKDGPGRDIAAPSWRLTHGKGNKPVRWEKPGREYARGQVSQQEAINLYGENKRKHAVYAQDDQRRYSDEILEDIPHMSEIDADAGFRSPCKDVFGMKAHKGLFVETVRPASDRTCTGPIESIDSPPFEPPSPLINRPDLSPRTESNLRRSCAVILQDYKESAQVYEDILTKGYHKLDEEEERANTAVKPPGEAQAQKASFSRHKRNPSDPVPAPAPYTHVPTNAAASFEHTVARRKPSQRHHREHVAFEPLEPTHSAVSPVAFSSQDPIHRIRANLEQRPKTFKAAGVDYSEDTSSSTTRTNTTYDIGRSTGLTSAALTPGDNSTDKRFSQSISEQILQDAPAASLADATAKAWMAQELTKRRAETASAPPPSRARAEPERPQSRAGSIKEGIRQYIRPRASQDSLRSVARSESVSREENNGKNGGTWWRGGSLRRRGSNSSFRSGQDNQTERPLSFSREADLNRALPALPGLDNWQEKKKPTMHIAHMMRGGGAVTTKSTTLGPSIGSKKTKEKPTIIDNDGMERTLSKSEERLRQKDLKKAVEEKMSKGAIVTPSVSAGLVEARQKSLDREKKKATSMERSARRQTMRARESVILTKTPEVVVKDGRLGEVGDTEKKEKEKGGLRKRFSRFMFLGSSNNKAGKSERKGFGKMVEYEGP
ncbi:MAG: hypothetical protein M1830_008703 [Pleopsidium flavum]|nr:MAG: hypothetical protein M1830_008703 [Pleopsidium flavum]